MLPVGHFHEESYLCLTAKSQLTVLAEVPVGNPDFQVCHSEASFAEESPAMKGT